VKEAAAAKEASLKKQKPRVKKAALKKKVKKAALKNKTAAFSLAALDADLRKAAEKKKKDCPPAVQPRHSETPYAKAVRCARIKQASADARAMESLVEAKRAVKDAKGKKATVAARVVWKELREQHADVIKRSYRGISGWKSWRKK